VDPRFAALVEGLAPKLFELTSAAPARDGSLPREMPLSGIYLFTESGTHLYVGRSNNLRARYGRHCRPGATHRTAAFAFQLAREKTGRTVAAYRAGEDSRDGLMLNDAFFAAFTAAKQRIRAMEYRFVEETDQNRQALLEIYCAIVLETRYNDFGTHRLQRVACPGPALEGTGAPWANGCDDVAPLPAAVGYRRAQPELLYRPRQQRSGVGLT
jgi:hypothetical protein